jgi:serine/threonine-protein kinase
MDLESDQTIADSIPTVASIENRPLLSAERYTLGDVIGRGGMGEVYSARDRLMGREVAIKRLRGEYPDRALDRFMREACIQGRLEHPAIVPVHDLGVDADGVPFFVMKRLAGTTLTQILAKPDPQKHSRQRLLRAFVDVCYAMELAHSRGCVHRDLKPSNIVLGELGEVYVIDWGIAKVAGLSEPDITTPSPDDSELTVEGVALGTPGYMAPEQQRGDRDVDARADVFSLGCVLFEILTGQRLLPTSLSAISEVLPKLDARPSVRATQRDIAPELDSICVFATSINREHRPASARELAILVEKFLDGDRDLELRKRLAREQLDEATKAFEASDETNSHRTAMRHAGRALALDPTLIGAAELVGRLMLEPPRDVPEEVTKAITQDHVTDQQRAGRVGAFAYLGYIAVFVMVSSLGFSSPIYPILFSLFIVLNIALLAWYTRATAPRPILPLLLSSAAIIALMARMFSPFLIGPGLAAVTSMGFMLGIVPVTRAATIAVVLFHLGAIMVPWIIEELGWISRSFELTSSATIIYAPGLRVEDSAPPFSHTLVLAAYAVVLVIAAVYMAATIRRTEMAARRSLHLQAWQLRQLVPIKTIAATARK